MPTLDDVARDPSMATALPLEVVEQLLVKHNAAGQALLARLLAARAQNGAPARNETDRFLDAGQVGAMIGKSKSWIEKNPEGLPKRLKVGGEAKWSERELQAWMKRREPWD